MTRQDQSAHRNEKAGARGRLLESALDVFGQYGYEAATTRRIARRAGVNIAAIPYYFTGKEGLYRAVVEHVAGRIRDRLDPLLGEIDARTARADLAPEAGLDLLEALLGEMIEFMIGSEEAPRFVRIILREQLDPSAAYEVIFGRLMAPMMNAVAGLLAAAAKTPLSDTLRLRALSLMGQVMAFRVARETVVRALGVEGYSRAETREIRRIILEQIRAVAAGMKQKG